MFRPGALKVLVSFCGYCRPRKARKTKLKRRREESERHFGRRFDARRRQIREVGAEMGHVRGFGAKKIGEGIVGGSFGAKLGLRWGKGADLVPKKLEKGISEKRFCSNSLWVRTWKPTLGPSWGQEWSRRRSWGQDGGKLGPRAGKESGEEA